jgi:hypothetical protein
MSVRRTVVLLTILLAAACARTDLGSPCHVQNAAGGEVAQLPGRQYLYLGSSECDSFACLATQGSSGGYCSQACTGQGSSCPAGLTCTQLALNQTYLDTMKSRLTAQQFQQTFGQLGSSWYCVKPQ